MTIRTSIRTVRFTQHFRLDGIDDLQPPSDDDVTTEEEQLGGMNVPVWRRLDTTILVSRDDAKQSYTIDPVDLEASLLRGAGFAIVHTGGV